MKYRAKLITNRNLDRPKQIYGDVLSEIRDWALGVKPVGPGDRGRPAVLESPEDRVEVYELSEVLRETLQLPSESQEEKKP